MAATGQAQGAGSAAHTEFLAKFLHPRMIAEHVYSGGGTCLHRSIRSLLPGARFVGRALTVRTVSGFNRRVLEGLAAAGKGDVLVIAGGGDAEVAVWGGMTHWNATRKGLAGVVVDGMTRDLAEIRSFPSTTPLFACGQVPAIAGFGTPTTGAVGEPIVCGGVPVRTGDLIFGDDDGVVAVAWDQAKAVLELAMKCIEFDDKEQAWVESGREIADLLKMLWDPDGTAYKDRKYRWAAQKTLDPL